MPCYIHYSVRGHECLVTLRGQRARMPCYITGSEGMNALLHYGVRGHECLVTLRGSEGMNALLQYGGQRARMPCYITGVRGHECLVHHDFKKNHFNCDFSLKNVQIYRFQGYL